MPPKNGKIAKGFKSTKLKKKTPLFLSSNYYYFLQYAYYPSSNAPMWIIKRFLKKNLCLRISKLM